MIVLDDPALSSLTGATDTPQGYLSVSQSAAYLSVSTRTLYRHISAGRVDAYRLPSGRVRIAVADLDGLLQPRTVGGDR